MKNKLSILGAFAIIACAAVSLTGCFTTSAAVSERMSRQNRGAFAEVSVPVKDFESLGMVFIETKFEVASNGTVNGEAFTFQELLKEAQKLGADAIVNVSIDIIRRESRVTDSVTRTDFGDTSQSIQETETETWYGSALAIKYTGALAQANTVSPSRQYQLDSGSSDSSEQPASSGQPGKKAWF